MLKTDISDSIAVRYDIDKNKAADMVDDMFDIISEAVLSGEKVSIRKFGSISLKTHSRRVSVNPRTREPMEIPETKSISFAPSTVLKMELRKRYLTDNRKMNSI